MDDNKISIERGVVKIYFSMKEFGFIARDKGKDLFFIRSSFEDELQIAEGAVVEFIVLKASQGQSNRAINIKRIA